MPFYADTDQFYRSLRALFQCIQESHPRAGDQVIASRLVIRMKLSAPAGEIIINGRQSPVQTSFGPNSARPDVDIDLPADVLHRILLGQVSLTKALGSGQLKVKGPIWKTMALSEIFRVSQECYPAILKDQGLGDR